MKNSIFKFLTLAGLLALCLPAHATIVYNVTSTGQAHCGLNPSHGLWTASDFGGSCGNYFDISGTFTIDDSNSDSSLWTADFIATATNPQSVVATIDLDFGGYTEDHTTIGQIKNGGGGDPSTWAFFNTISGSISFSSQSIEGVSSFVIDDMVGSHAFQIGFGANDKTSAFGASAWIQGDDMRNIDSNPNYHWDLNLDFEVVPEPATLVLLGFGLLGLGFGRKKSF